jgi:hypothetical protein
VGVHDIDLLGTNQFEELPKSEVVDALPRRARERYDVHARSFEFLADGAPLLQIADGDVEAASVDGLGQMANHRFGTADPQR